MISFTDIARQLSWRYATKKFDTEKKLTNEEVDSIVEAMRLAPSSYGLQPWRFIVITDKALREQLREVSYDQPQVTDASHLIVVAHATEITENDIDQYISNIAEVRKIEKSELDGFKAAMKGDILERAPAERSAWAARQAYIALGFGLETAALLGIDACPMEGFQSGSVTELLGLQGLGYQAVAYMALGHRANDDKYANEEKVRYTAEKVIDWRI